MLYFSGLSYEWESGVTALAAGASTGVSVPPAAGGLFVVGAAAAAPWLPSFPCLSRLAGCQQLETNWEALKMHLFPIPSALFNPLTIPSRILHKGFCTALLFAQCLELKQVSQQSGAVWGPGRDSLFLLSSLLLHPPGHSLVLQKVGCHLLAQACPGPRAGALTETSVVPAVILVVWRSGHGYVRAGNTGRYFCVFPSISLKIKPVTIDSLRISQKQRESSFISSLLASGHVWMHDKCITAFSA